MNRSAMVPGVGMLSKNGVYELAVTDAMYVVNRDYGSVHDGSCLVDLILDKASLPEIAQHYSSLNVVERELSGKAHGAVHIVGCGPSASDFNREHIGKDDVVIACNAAISLVNPDIALIVEGVSIGADWFDEALKFTGTKVFDCAIASQMRTKQALQYSNRFWQSVLWVRRRAYVAGEDLSKIGNGLVYDTSSGQIRGTVVAQGVHLAKIMGATEIHTWGTELCFPDGKQHFYPGNVYTPGDTPESVVTIGGVETTRYFAESAAAIRNIIGWAGLKHTDHSGGLL